MYAILTQEPWCFHPDQVARLTDEQIDRLYVLPAVKRNEEMRAGRPEPEPAARAEAAPEITKEGYIRTARAMFGWPAERAAAEWDRQTAMMEEQQDAPQPPTGSGHAAPAGGSAG